MNCVLLLNANNLIRQLLQHLIVSCKHQIWDRTPFPRIHCSLQTWFVPVVLALTFFFTWFGLFAWVRLVVRLVECDHSTRLSGSREWSISHPMIASYYFSSRSLIILRRQKKSESSSSQSQSEEGEWSAADNQEEFCTFGAGNEWNEPEFKAVHHRGLKP